MYHESEVVVRISSFEKVLIFAQSLKDYLVFVTTSQPASRRGEEDHFNNVIDVCDNDPLNTVIEYIKKMFQDKRE